MKICSTCAEKLKKITSQNYQFEIGTCGKCKNRSYVAKEEDWGIRKQKLEDTDFFNKLFGR